MFLFRFAFVAIIAVMLLPTGPSDNRSLIGLADKDDGFCSRYPNTCAASEELYTAFTKKLSYGITLARQSLHAQDDTGERYAGAPTRDENFGEERPPRRWDGTNRRERGGLFSDERSTQ